MASIFTEKDSVFFVGGRGTKAGDANAGGCTKAAWEDAGLINKDLTNVMGANGETICSVIADVTNNGSGKCRITRAGLIPVPCMGYITKVEFDGLHASGRYEVIDYDEANWIDIDLAFIGAEQCFIRVGGAFDTLQNAIDNTDASQGYNVTVYDNKPATLAAAIDFDTTGGSIANNSQMIVEAFNTQPGDMNKGGDYHQGPFDCLKNGVDTTKCVTLDANGGAYDVIALNDFDGLVLKNFYLYNTDKGAGNNGVAFSNSPKNISFINCRFDTLYDTMSGTVYGFVMNDCYSGNDFGFGYGLGTFTAFTGIFLNCVMNGDGLTGCSYMTGYVFFDGCLFWKSAYGLRFTKQICLKNCIFYGQTDRCLYPNDATYGVAMGHNNIFIPAAADDFVFRSATAQGSVSDDALVNSCVWTLAGVQMTNHIYINGITRQLSSVIEADPLFKDAVNNDFKLKINSPCLKTGIQTL